MRQWCTMTAARLDRQGRRGAYNRILTQSHSREQRSPAGWFCTLALGFKHILLLIGYASGSTNSHKPITLSSLVNSHLIVSQGSVAHCPRAKQMNLKDLSFPVWIWHQTGSSLQPNRLSLHSIIKEADLKAAMQQLQYHQPSVHERRWLCCLCGLGHVSKRDYGSFQQCQDESLMALRIHGNKNLQMGGGVVLPPLGKYPLKHVTNT